MVPVRLRLDLDPLRTLLPFLCVPMVLLALGMGLREWILDQRRCLLHTAGEVRKRRDHEGTIRADVTRFTGARTDMSTNLRARVLILAVLEFIVGGIVVLGGAALSAEFGSRSRRSNYRIQLCVRNYPVNQRISLERTVFRLYSCNSRGSSHRRVNCIPTDGSKPQTAASG